MMSGALRKGEEYGKAFPKNSIIVSTADSSVPLLPIGNHLVISTPGVEPRGTYSAIIFLDLEYRLARTTLRAAEELRLQLFRSLTMLESTGSAFLSLPQSSDFFQSILRSRPLQAANREIAERDIVKLPPHYLTVLISDGDIEVLNRVMASIQEISIVGPFMRSTHKTLLLKSRSEDRSEVAMRLLEINKVRSLRKEPLMSYRIDPYSLN